jgi:membrane protein DedA with SNARE-associated domain/rhodanese-related sulfurtransferase
LNIQWGTDAAGGEPTLVFACVLAGALGAPFPTVAALVYAGSMLAKEEGGVALVAATILAGMAGAAVGDVVWFTLGRKLGASALGLMCRLSLSRDTCIRKTAGFFYKWGLSTLLFARFLPGLSIVSAPMAGASGFSFGKYIFFALAGDALWISTGLTVGYFLSDQFRALVQIMAHYGIDVGYAVLFGFIAYLCIRLYRRERMRLKLRMARITVDQLTAMMSTGTKPVIVDVRASWQRDKDAAVIPGSLVLDLKNLSKAFSKLPKDHPIVIYCSCPNETSAAVGARKLLQLGFTDVRPLLGGLQAWRESGSLIEMLSRETSREEATAGLAIELT